MTNCTCGKPTLYAKECRDCYENRLRFEVRDESDRNSSVGRKVKGNTERNRVKLYKNYEGNPPG